MTTPTMTPNEIGERLLGGVSSTFRINPYTGTHIEVADAHGALLQTTDGRTFIDMFMAHGSTVLGHAHPAVMAAVREALEAGVVIGYETGAGERVARQIGEFVPSAEAVRFVASGSEAVSTALRVARAYTGRELVIKIDGHYNGGQRLRPGQLAGGEHRCRQSGWPRLASHPLLCRHPASDAGYCRAGAVERCRRAR